MPKNLLVFEKSNYGRNKIWPRSQTLWRFNWKKGKTAEDLLAEYAMFGEDPITLPIEHSDLPSFSARTYAVEIHETICKKLQAKKRK